MKRSSIITALFLGLLAHSLGCGSPTEPSTSSSSTSSTGDTANSTSGTVSVLLTNGNGTFAPKVDYPAGYGPSSVTAADLNGDGRIDLAVANYNSNTVSALLTSCLP